MSNLNPTREETDALAPVSISIIKKKRSLPGHPDPDAEVIALSPRSLLATNKFVCEICQKGYQRDQNLQLHRRGHNLPWRLKQKASHEVKKKVYVCPESTCVHHNPARALGDLTGIKKHFSRKHGEKKWKCDKCSKRYAVQSDWKAHQKTCGTREYRCDCGTMFSRKDSFITHRAFCEALAEENGKGLPHRQWENQQSAACLDNKGHNGSLGEDRSAAMEAASSPISQLTGDALTSSEVSKPISAKISSDFTLPECGIASLSSKWIQGGIGANSASLSKGPGLSLCLGTGPGPGPPSALQMMGSQTPSGSGPPFIMPSLKGLNKLGFSRMPGSESHDTSMHVSSSTGAMDMLANLFSSSENGRSRHDGSNGMAGVSGYTRLLNHDDQLTIPSFAMLPGGSSTSISSMMMNDFGSPNGRSKTSLQRTASAPMSATALLQKAAQMGATASNPSLLQKFGMRVGESSSSTAAGGVQRQASWAGVSSIISSSMPAYSTMRQAEDLRSGSSDCRAGGLVFPSASGHGSMQGFMNSISGGAGLFGSALHDMASAVGPSTNGNNFLKHADMLRDKELSNTLNGRPSFGGRVALQPGHGGPPRSGGDTQMLDFLGVGCPSGTVAGTSAGIGQILSHRDLASITALNAGIKVENSMFYQDDNRGARQLYPS